jgi:hypothetical protein
VDLGNRDVRDEIMVMLGGEYVGLKRKVPILILRCRLFG